MTRFLTFLLTLGISVSTHAAPKLYAVFVIDSDAGQVGADIAPGCYENKNRMVEVFNEIFSGERAGRFEYWVLDGGYATPNYIKSVLRNDVENKSTSEDTVMVYYCGHGTVDKDNNHVFAMSGGHIPRHEVRSQLLDVTSRLAVLLSDTCSSYEGQVPIPARNVPAEWEVFKQLFFGTSGLVDITAARPGEFAWSTRQGGFFSRALINLFCEGSDELDSDDDGTVTWKEFFNKLQRDTNAIFSDAKEGASSGSEITGSDSQWPSSWSLGSYSFAYTVKIINDRSDTLCFWADIYAWNPQTRTWGWTGVHRWEIDPGETTTLSVDDWQASGNKFRWWATNLAGTVSYGSKTRTTWYNDPHPADETRYFTLRFAD